MQDIGKLFLLLGILFIILSAVWTIGSKYFSFGKLPGDISIEKEHFYFYFPLATSIIISIILSILLWFFLR